MTNLGASKTNRQRFRDRTMYHIIIFSVLRSPGSAGSRFSCDFAMPILCQFGRGKGKGDAQKGGAPPSQEVAESGRLARPSGAAS